MQGFHVTTDGEQMIWNDCKLSNPEPMTEVLVWIDGKRGTSWKNNHALVAYITPTGEWFEERHPSYEPLVGVIAWTPITDPDAQRPSSAANRNLTIITDLSWSAGATLLCKE